MESTRSYLLKHVFSFIFPVDLHIHGSQVFLHSYVLRELLFQKLQRLQRRGTLTLQKNALVTEKVIKIDERVHISESFEKKHKSICAGSFSAPLNTYLALDLTKLLNSLCIQQQQQ